MLFSTLGSSSLLVAVAQPDERHANRTEHISTSSSNEEDHHNYDMSSDIPKNSYE